MLFQHIIRRSLLVLLVDRAEDESLQIFAAGLSPDSGLVQEQRLLFRLRDVWDGKPPAAWTKSDRSIVLTVGGVTASISPVFDVEWLDRPLWLPPQADLMARLDELPPRDLLAIEGGAEDRDYAAAGLDYGAKDQPFTTLGELQQLLGMDLATYRLLVPYVTVHTAMPRPEAGFAQRPVLQALGLSPGQAAELLALREAWRPGLPLPLLPDGSTLAVAGSGTYSVASRATRPDGTLVEVHATLRIGAGSGFGQLYAPLAWRTGEPY